MAPRRAQPVEFAMPPLKDAGDVAAAIGAVLRAAAKGLIAPAEAESLMRAAEAGARAIETAERVARERLAVEQEAVERRFGLRVCALLFYGVREIAEEAGPFDGDMRERCKPILQLGEAALAALAAIPDTPELLDRDRAFLADHPPRLDRETSELATMAGRAWQELRAYFSPSRMDRIEERIAEREAAGTLPQPRYRTGLFERLLGICADEPGASASGKTGGSSAPGGDRLTQPMGEPT